MSFVISTDSGANIPMNIIEENHLIVIPLAFIYDGVEHTVINLDEFDGHEYYELIKTTDVTTSTVNPQQYFDEWESFLKDGKDILHISMSSGISSTYQSSCIARDMALEDYPDRKVLTIDTYAASLGEALSVFEAIDLKNEGKNIDDIYEIILKDRHSVRQVFTVDDLMFLQKGGRLSKAAALIGSMLSIKPILQGNEIGQIVVDHKERGRKSALKALVKDYAEKVLDPNKVATIAHSDCIEDTNWVISEIQKIHPEQKFITEIYEPVTGCHVGPRTVALFYYRK